MEGLAIGSKQVECLPSLDRRGHQELVKTWHQELVKTLNAIWVFLTLREQGHPGDGQNTQGSQYAGTQNYRKRKLLRTHAADRKIPGTHPDN